MAVILPDPTELVVTVLTTASECDTVSLVTYVTTNLGTGRERMKDVMTTKEAANVLGVKPESISRLIRLGKLKGERFGHAWMVYRDSVEQYSQAVTGKAKNDPTRKLS